MTLPPVEALLAVAGPPLGNAITGPAYTEAIGLSRSLGEVLLTRNGFYAFGRALLVRPLRGCQPLGVVEWNAADLWKHEYPEPVHALCFAEDAFGVQFGLLNGRVVSLDPETGKIEDMAGSLDEWARLVVADSEFRTGRVLLGEWERRHGALGAGMRLVPRKPFVCGGGFDLENMVAMKDADAMRFRGNLATQIRDVPDGGQIVFRVV